jgi:hypothetical protein
MPAQELLAELESAYSNHNVDYEAAAKYYDSNLINFYKSKMWQACYRFSFMNEGQGIIDGIDWGKVLTNKFVICDQTDPGAMCKDLSNTHYVKDVYYDLAVCVYKYRHILDTDTIKLVQRWLAEHGRHKPKPFFMCYMVGMCITNDYDDFIIAKDNIKSVNWSTIE